MSHVAVAARAQISGVVTDGNTSDLLYLPASRGPYRAQLQVTAGTGHKVVEFLDNKDVLNPTGQMTGDPDLTFADAGPDTITRSAGSWIDDGFVAGMSIEINRKNANGPGDLLNHRAAFTIAAGGVTATVLTLEGADAVVAETDASGYVVNGDGPRPGPNATAHDWAAGAGGDQEGVLRDQAVAFRVVASGGDVTYTITGIR